MELRHAARLAEIRRLAQAPQVIVVQPPAGYYSGPVPAVGFAAPGRGGFSWIGGHHHGVTRNGGWDSVGIATIGAGSGGIYVPQSGGFLFTGLPQVHQSPTLGWYDPGGFASPAARSAGTFGGVPGLAVPNPPAVVPGVQVRGSVSMPAGH